MDGLEIKICQGTGYFPEEFRKLKEEHYKETFGEGYAKVYEESEKIIDINEDAFIIGFDKKPVARAVVRYGKYSMRIRDFTVLKEYRRLGIAKKLMEAIEENALKYHDKMLREKMKAYDIMLLETYIYPKSSSYGQANPPYNKRFEMSNFLERNVFKAYKYNPKTLSKEEKLALEAYTQFYPEFLPLMKTYKKTLANRIELREEIKEELSKLGTKEDLVLKSLETKLKVYEERGFISYKYDICAICNDMKSTLENSSRCKMCYIQKTCEEPFLQSFKEDNEISYEYFKKAREFIKSIMHPH